METRPAKAGFPFPPTIRLAGEVRSLDIRHMETDTYQIPSFPPPAINGKPYHWVDSAMVEVVMGMAWDELNLYPNKRRMFLTLDYRRLDQNCWVLMNRTSVVRDRGRPIVWNDNILKARMRPDVAIVNPQDKTYHTSGQ